MQLEKEKNEIEWYKAKNDKNFKDQDIEAKKQQIQAEVLQLYDGNNKNDEIKNIV
jgi:c-di-AMP phosphodiesterase-like protein